MCGGWAGEGGAKSALGPVAWVPPRTGERFLCACLEQAPRLGCRFFDLHLFPVWPPLLLLPLPARGGDGDDGGG